MKRVLFLALILLVPFMAFAAAVTGNGTVTTTLASEVLTGDYVASQSFTVTLGAVYTKGSAWFKWPRTWAPVETANIALSGTATEAKKIVKENWLGDTYYKVTITGTALQTVIVEFKGVTLGATAGAQTFTWLTADTSTSLSTASAIASQPATYLWSASKAVSVGTVGPSPVVANDDINPFIAQVVWGVSPNSGGQIRWRLVSGTPGYQSTPNPVTLASSTTTGKNNASWVVCTPGALDTPVCSSFECYANIKAAATISIGDKVQIFIGHPTPAVSVTPWHGTNYAKNMRIDIMANACRSAATETPVSYPTAAVNGNFSFLVPTPTVCLTLTTLANGYQFNTNDTALTSAKTVYSMGTAIKNRSGVFNPTDFGSYSCSGVVFFKDVNNDGELRSNTTSAITVYKMPVVTSVGEAVANGLLVPESVENSFCNATTPLLVTIYADAQYFYDADIFGNSTAVFYAREVGSDAANVTFTSYVLVGNVPTGKGFINPVIPAESVLNIDLITGSDNEWNLRLLRAPLPAR